MGVRKIGRWLAFVAGIAGTATLAACGPDASAPIAPDVLLAKGGGGGTGVSVTATSPAYAKRGTTLDVRVIGSGFTSDAVVEWALAGVKNPAQVRTNATTFVSSTELIANITVSSDAQLAYWDVTVTMAGGKNGIGTELLEVTTATEIGTLGGNTQVYGMNGAGTLVGWSNIGTTQYAFVWEPSAPGATTGTIAALSPGTAWDVDEEGTTIVGVSGGRAAIWTRDASGGWSTSPQHLPAILGGVTATSGNARAIVTVNDGSGDQVIAGSLSFPVSRRSSVGRAVTWRRSAGGAWGAPVALPSPAGSTNTFAVDLSRNLTVVGNSPDVSGTGVGGPTWDYTNGAWVLTAQLPALPGDVRGTPTAIDPNGTIIVGESASNASRPVFWTRPGGTWQVTALPTSTSSGRPLDVSATGVIVGQGAYWQLSGSVAAGPFVLPGIGVKNSTGSAHAVNAAGTRAAGGYPTNSRGLLWELP